MAAWILLFLKEKTLMEPKRSQIEHLLNITQEVVDIVTNRSGDVTE